MRLNERVIVAIERRALARVVLKRCRKELTLSGGGTRFSLAIAATNAAQEQWHSAEAEYDDVLAGVEDRALAADADWQKARLWREPALEGDSP